MTLKETVEAKMKEKSGKHTATFDLWEQIFKTYNEGGKKAIEEKIIKTKVDEILCTVKEKAQRIKALIDEL